MRVVHVDSAHEWRGSQSQVLLAAQGMADQGHVVTVACQSGGRLESRARAAGRMVEQTLRVCEDVCGSMAVSDRWPIRPFEPALGLTTLARGSEASEG